MSIWENPIFLNSAATLAIIVGISIIRQLLLRFMHRVIKDTSIYYKSKRSLSSFLYAIMFVFVAIIWFEAGSGFMTYFGLISAGIAVALKDPVTNMAAWLFILVRKPFSVGDRIEIANVRGDVIDQRLFQFSLMEVGNWVDSDQSTGRIIQMPNQKIFTDHTANYTLGFAYIWHEIPVLLTFESDWRHMKTILMGIAEKHSLHLSDEASKGIRQASKKFMILYKNLTPIVYTDVKESGIQLTIRYLCVPQMRRNTHEAIWEDVLDYIEASETIHLAYPTLRVTMTNTTHVTKDN